MNDRTRKAVAPAPEDALGDDPAGYHIAMTMGVLGGTSEQQEQSGWWLIDRLDGRRPSQFALPWADGLFRNLRYLLGDFIDASQDVPAKQRVRHLVALRNSSTM